MDPREYRSELELTRLAREGRTAKQNPAGGEHMLRLPWEDLKALARFFPGLLSVDPKESSAALDELFKSPLCDKYRVARTPTQVQRNPRRPIIVRP